MNKIKTLLRKKYQETLSRVTGEEISDEKFIPFEYIRMFCDSEFEYSYNKIVFYLFKSNKIDFTEQEEGTIKNIFNEFLGFTLEHLKKNNLKEYLVKDFLNCKNKEKE